MATQDAAREPAGAAEAVAERLADWLAAPLRGAGRRGGGGKGGPRSPPRTPPASPPAAPGPVAERLADWLAAQLGGPVRQQVADRLRELGAGDRAIYGAGASTPDRKSTRLPSPGHFQSGAASRLARRATRGAGPPAGCR